MKRRYTKLVAIKFDNQKKYNHLEINHLERTAC